MKLEDIEKALEKKTKEPWTATGNYPFYVDMRKPAPSLSKHDNERPTYWRYEDAEFVLIMANGGAQFLVDEIKRLQAELEKK